MDKTNTGGPAFPGVLTNTSNEEKIGLEGEAIPPHHQAEYSGMTLRDYFAGQALVRIVAADEDGIMGPDITARACYSLADAMLRARAAQ